MVFTPQGYTLSSGALGHHSHGNTGGFLDPDDAQDGVVTSTIQAVPNPAPTANQSPSKVNFVPPTPLDTMTETFSHELAEILTNPEDNGVQTTPPGSFTYSSVENPGEIGETRASSTSASRTARWSSRTGRPPGATTSSPAQAQRVSTSGGTLTIKGDSLAVTDDTLTITTASGGVQVTLDGERRDVRRGPDHAHRRQPRRRDQRRARRRPPRRRDGQHRRLGRYDDRHRDRRRGTTGTSPAPAAARSTQSSRSPRSRTSPAACALQLPVRARRQHPRQHRRRRRS